MWIDLFKSLNWSIIKQVSMAVSYLEKYILKGLDINEICLWQKQSLDCRVKCGEEVPCQLWVKSPNSLEPGKPFHVTKSSII